MYAIIRSGGKQYRVREGDRIEVELLDAAEGTEVTLGDVLLVEDGSGVRVGAPLVDGAAVQAVVEAQVRAPKVNVFKYKNKVHYRRLRGHRQPLTRLAITSITPGA